MKLVFFNEYKQIPIKQELLIFKILNLTTFRIIEHLNSFKYLFVTVFNMITFNSNLKYVTDNYCPMNIHQQVVCSLLKSLMDFIFRLFVM